MERVAIGTIFDIILLAREYAPNSSGPKPLAKKRMINIIDVIAIREVTVVVTMFFRKGVNLILNIYEVKQEILIIRTVEAKFEWIF